MGKNHWRILGWEAAGDHAGCHLSPWRAVGEDRRIDNFCITAGMVGLHFEKSRYAVIQNALQAENRLEIVYKMPLTLRWQDERIPGCGGMFALTRGPVVYYLESTDNMDDIFSAVIDSGTLKTSWEPNLLGGTVVIEGISESNQPYMFIPYLLWGNRGESQMTVFFKVGES